MEISRTVKRTKTIATRNAGPGEIRFSRGANSPAGETVISIRFAPADGALSYRLGMTLAEWDALKESVESRLREASTANGGRGIITPEELAERNKATASPPAMVHAYKLRDHSRRRWWVVIDNRGRKQSGGLLKLGESYDGTITRALQKWEQLFGFKIPQGKLTVHSTIYDPAELAAGLAAAEIDAEDAAKAV